MNPSFKEKAEEIVKEYVEQPSIAVLVKNLAEALSQERENTLRLPEIQGMAEALRDIIHGCCYGSDLKAIHNKAAEALSNFNNLLGGKS